MRRKFALTAVLAVALAVVGYAQKTDFSGTWTPDEAGTAAPAGGGGGGGRGMAGPMTVKQTADSLTVERQGRNGAMSMVYKLDGSEIGDHHGPDDGEGDCQVGRQQARDHDQDRQGESHADLVARRQHV